MNNDELSQGPEEQSGVSGHFLHIAGGKIIERTTADNPKAIKRTPKPKEDGTPRPDVYELHYNAFSGVIEGMHNRERTVPWQDDPIKSTVVSLRAGGEMYHLEMEHKSRYWSIFVNCLATDKIDFSRGVRIKPWDYERKTDGKRVIGLGVYQMATAEQKEAAQNPDSGITLQEDGTVQVPWRWTKEKPGKLPQAIQIPIPGKKPVWSFEARDEYMRAVVEHYAERLKAAHEESMSEAERAAAQPKAQEAAPVAQAAPAKAMPTSFPTDEDGPAPFTEDLDSEGEPPF